MASFLTDALTTADLVGAATRNGVNLVELRRARAMDPGFDLAMAEVDTAMRLAAISAVEAKAAAGDLKAIRALTDGTLGTLIEQTDDEPQPVNLLEALNQLPIRVSNAMLDAKQRAEGQEPPAFLRDKVQCAFCGKWQDATIDPDHSTIQLSPQRTPQDGAALVEEQDADGCGAERPYQPRRCTQCDTLAPEKATQCRKCGGLIP
jgi:hypothetical protein